MGCITAVLRSSMRKRQRAGALQDAGARDGDRGADGDHGLGLVSFGLHREQRWAGEKRCRGGVATKIKIKFKFMIKQSVSTVGAQEGVSSSEL